MNRTLRTGLSRQLVRRGTSSCHGKVRSFVLSVRADAGHDIGWEIGTMRRDVAFWGTAVVVASAVVNAAHTASHAGQHVMSLPLWQLAYIAVVIYASPVVAAVLLWTRYRLAGAWLLAAAMAGSLVFGLLYHFLISGPDNVFTQPPGTWRTAFGVSAALLAPLQVIGGAIGLWATQKPSSPFTGAARRRGVGRPARLWPGSGSDPR